MRKILMFFIFSSHAFATQPPHLTPSHCAWWLERLGNIAMWEELRIENWEKIYEAEGYQAALEFDMDLRGRVIAIMKQIDRATSEKPR